MEFTPKAMVLLSGRKCFLQTEKGAVSDSKQPLFLLTLGKAHFALAQLHTADFS
ncbi:hypothetical protein Geoth_0867 [Parageobacillus thermoglucosidasius C56-YS93]|nr:hypothetical protein Geoth_0867 [Parageobacillus thermoglucosidasius C56-YS93]